jgi:Rab-GTPase-TBC domain
MNNIVAKLITCMNEEDAFWTFCQTIELILPLDYYSNMLGVLVEQQVLDQIMALKFKALQNHL